MTPPADDVIYPRDNDGSVGRPRRAARQGRMMLAVQALLENDEADSSSASVESDVSGSDVSSNEADNEESDVGS